jgi:phosphoribosylformimino-5-aminoimidazole carboxamide ribonucleotide (ProFAR) isomerase
VWEPESLTGWGERVVAAVDVRGDKATGAGWLDEGRDIAEVLAGLAVAGVPRLLVTGISRDGTLAGPDFGLTRSVVADERFGVIASGGVAELAHVDVLAAMGCEAAIVGRALYEGRFTLAEARNRLPR